MSGQTDMGTQAAKSTFETLNAALERRRKERQAVADAENDRRAKLMSAMSSLGSGVGQMGMA